MTQQILQQIQLEVGPEQVVSARLLPVDVEEVRSPRRRSNGAPAGKAAKAAAAAAALAEVGAPSDEE